MPGYRCPQRCCAAWRVMPDVAGVRPRDPGSGHRGGGHLCALDPGRWRPDLNNSVSKSAAAEGEMAVELGALGGTRTPNLLTRKMKISWACGSCPVGTFAASGARRGFGECQQAWPGWPARPAEVM